MKETIKNLKAVVTSVELYIPINYALCECLVGQFERFENKRNRKIRFINDDLGRAYNIYWQHDNAIYDAEIVLDTVAITICLNLDKLTKEAVHEFYWVLLRYLLKPVANLIAASAFIHNVDIGLHYSKQTLGVYDCGDEADQMRPVKNITVNINQPMSDFFVSSASKSSAGHSIVSESELNNYQIRYRAKNPDTDHEDIPTQVAECLAKLAAFLPPRNWDEACQLWTDY